MKFLQDNPTVKSLTENRPLKLILTAFLLICCIGLLQTFMPGLLSGMVGAGIMVMIVFFTIALIVQILFGGTAKNSAAEKQKRGLEGADMYSMIDRLVDELDDDEMAYLRRRLEAHEQGSDRDLSHSLEVLLDKRSTVSKDK